MKILPEAINRLSLFKHRFEGFLRISLKSAGAPRPGWANEVCFQAERVPRGRLKGRRHRRDLSPSGKKERHPHSSLSSPEAFPPGGPTPCPKCAPGSIQRGSIKPGLGGGGRDAAVAFAGLCSGQRRGLHECGYRLPITPWGAAQQNVCKAQQGKKIASQLLQKQQMREKRGGSFSEPRPH